MPSSSSVSLSAVAARSWSPSSDIPPGKLGREHRKLYNTSRLKTERRTCSGNATCTDAEWVRATHLTWFLCLVSWPDLIVKRMDGLPRWRWSGTSTAACLLSWEILAVAGFSLAATAALFRALRIP